MADANQSMLAPRRTRLPTALRIGLRLIVPVALVLVPTVTVAAEAGAGTGASYPVPTSIDRTGATDVTGALVGFVAGVPDGSTIVFPAGARYRIEGTLYVPNRHDLTFMGNGATFFATTDGTGTTPPPMQGASYLWPRQRAHWLLDGGSNLTLDGITVDGANPRAGATNDAYVAALEEQDAFRFHGVAGATLRNCAATDPYGDFVTVDGGSSFITVTNCSFDRSGRQGMSVVNGTDVTLDANSVSNTGRSAFDLEPATANWQVRRVTISHNTVGRANGVFVADAGQGSNVSDISVVSNQLNGEPMNVVVSAPSGNRRSNFSILNNTSDAPFGGPTALMRFIRADNVRVSGNYQQVAPYTTTGNGTVLYAGIAVATSESCNVSVTANAFPGATQVLLQSSPSC